MQNNTLRAESFNPVSRFDQFLSNYRYNRVFQSIKKNPHIQSMIDMGCGSGNLVKIFKQKGFEARGIDVCGGENIIAADLNKPIPVETNSVDLVTSLANLEHLDKPEINLQEIHRILKPQGLCVLTTPSTAAKPVLEFLAYRLKLIDRKEIDDHKMYFSKQLLIQYFKRAGFEKVMVKYFQMGLNLHAIAIK